MFDSFNILVRPRRLQNLLPDRFMASVTPSHLTQPLLLNVDYLVNFLHQLRILALLTERLPRRFGRLALLIEDLHEFFVNSGDILLPLVHLFHLHLHQLYLLLVKGLLLLVLTLLSPEFLLHLEKIVIGRGLDRVESV